LRLRGIFLCVNMPPFHQAPYIFYLLFYFIILISLHLKEVIFTLDDATVDDLNGYSGRNWNFKTRSYLKFRCKVFQYGAKWIGVHVMNAFLLRNVEVNYRLSKVSYQKLSPGTHIITSALLHNSLYTCPKIASYLKQ